MRRSDRTLDWMLVWAMAVVTAAFLILDAADSPGPDPEEAVAADTGGAVVVLDTSEARPVWRDSFSVCRVRLCQHLGDCGWREPMGVGR